MKPKINVITLGVSDFFRSVAFYKGGLGWSAELVGDTAFFQLNGIILSIYPKDALAKDATISPHGSGFGGITLSYNTKNEKEVEHVLEEAHKAGAKIVKKASKTEWGGFNGYFSDPDGYLWEVVYNPFWGMDREGNVLL